jgi:hypothetical protein
MFGMFLPYKSWCLHRDQKRDADIWTFTLSSFINALFSSVLFSCFHLLLWDFIGRALSATLWLVLIPCGTNLYRITQPSSCTQILAKGSFFRKYWCINLSHPQLFIFLNLKIRFWWLKFAYNWGCVTFWQLRGLNWQEGRTWLASAALKIPQIHMIKFMKLFEDYEKSICTFWKKCIFNTSPFNVVSLRFLPAMKISSFDIPTGSN